MAVSEKPDEHTQDKALKSVMEFRITHQLKKEALVGLSVCVNRKNAKQQMYCAE